MQIETLSPDEIQALWVKPADFQVPDFSACTDKQVIAYWQGRAGYFQANVAKVKEARDKERVEERERAKAARDARREALESDLKVEREAHDGTKRALADALNPEAVEARKQRQQVRQAAQTKLRAALDKAGLTEAEAAEVSVGLK